MKLQNQVCTLEQGLELRKLGIVQVSQFHHFCTGFHSDGNGNYPPKYIVAHHKDAPEGYVGGEGCAAFTLAELMELLPSENEVHRTGSESSQYANWEWMNFGNEVGHGLYNTAAQAAADALIYHLENKLVTPEECNERLLNA